MQPPPPAGGEVAALVRDSPADIHQLLNEARAFQPVDPQHARVLAMAAAEAAVRIGDLTGQAHAAYRLASLAYVTGAIDEALAHVVEARALAKAARADVVEAWSLNLLGLVHMHAGNYSEALELCLEALEVYRRTDHHVDEGNLLNGIASIHVQLGDIDRALRTYAEALEANHSYGRPEHDAIVIANIAHLRMRRGDTRLAIAIGKEAVELAREHAPSQLPDVLTNLGEAHDAAGEHERALELFEQALAENEDAERDGRNVAQTSRLNGLLARGRSRLGGGDPGGAEADLLAALAGAEAEGARQLQLDAHAALADLLKAKGDYEGALAHAEARFTLNQELFNEGTDLRIRTLQIAHDTEHARQEAEIYRLRTTELQAMVQERTSDLEAFQLETLTRLAVLGEFRDTDTGEHTVRVGDMSAQIAAGLGLERGFVDRLRVSGRLHDIGKVGIPDSILLKPGALTPAEYEVMKTHSLIGARVLAGSTSPFIQLAEEVALSHHERWDGTGYPYRRAGDEIPISGRIVTVADVFDALTSERPYKRQWTLQDAVKYITQAAGSQFDPDVVAEFVKLIAARYPQLPFDTPVPAGSVRYL